MPPRYVYWTILIDNKPTSFRAQDKEELLPTLGQLRRTNKDVVMKYFAHGRVWDSPEAAREHARKPEPTEKRGRDWRPGGSHADPRARFDGKKKASAMGQPREPGKAVGTGRTGKPSVPGPGGADVPRTEGKAVRPGGEGASTRRPWTPKPAGDRRPWTPNPNSDRRPWNQKPESDRRPWSPKPNDERRPWQNKSAGAGRLGGPGGAGRPGGTSEPRTEGKAGGSGWPGKSHGAVGANRRPWTPKLTGERPPWTPTSNSERRPWSPNPNAERRPWQNKSTGGGRPSGAGRQGGTSGPRTEGKAGGAGWSGKPHGAGGTNRRPWTSKPAQERRPWTPKPSGQSEKKPKTPEDE